MGLGGLLLGAAAVALVVLSFGLLLAFVTLVLIAMGGLYIAAPEEARGLFKQLPCRIDGWIKEMRSMVDNAGEVLLTALGKRSSNDQTAADGDQSKASSEETQKS